MPIKLKFDCNQDWDEMIPSDCGKFCDLCKSNVTDFTKSSTEDILSKHSLEKNLCGLYNIEQLDSKIISPVSDVFSHRFFVIITSFTIGFSGKTLSAQINNPEIEQHDTISQIEETKSDIDTLTVEKHVCDKDCKCKESKVKNKEKKRSNRKKLYFTKRFPFIIYRRPRTMGPPRWI